MIEMKINCIDKDISEILNTGYFEIPRFQREYSWDKENVEDFWNDAIVNSGPEYFIGSMVVYKSGTDTYKVVDGQQRMTTITLLLAALREALKSLEHDALAHGVQEFIERKDVNYQPRFVLKTETSYPYLQEFIQKYEEPEVEPTIGQEEEALSRAFDLLQNKIDGTVEAIQLDPSKTERSKSNAIKKRLAEIRDCALRLKVIFINVDNEDDAYLIFETLNTRGKNLTVSDLVKNHLLYLLRQKNQGVDIPRDKWTSMLESFDASSADLKMSTFLHHYWLARYEYVTEKKLFKEIKKKVKKPQATNFLEGIVSCARTYREIHEPQFRKWKKEELAISNSLQALNLFRVRQQVPMVLAILSAYDSKKLTLRSAKDVLLAIENFHFSFTAVTSQRSSGGISFMYAHHARKLESGTASERATTLKELKKKLRERRPSFDEFLALFRELRYSDQYTKEKKLIQYILSKLDRHHRSGVALDYTQMTIEHVASQSLARKSQVPWDTVGSIGNLMLVDDVLNNKLGDKDFGQKKPILKRATSVWVDKTITSSSAWRAKEIEARTVELAKLAYEKVWKL
jgi:uncharacterized protein with ParB-like and HNH nuclease domain